MFFLLTSINVVNGSLSRVAFLSLSWVCYGINGCPVVRSPGLRDGAWRDSLGGPHQVCRSRQGWKLLASADTIGNLIRRREQLSIATAEPSAATTAATGQHPAGWKDGLSQPLPLLASL